MMKTQLAKDVTNSVYISDPDSVLEAVKSILERRYPRKNFKILDTLFRDLARLYRGDYPGFHPCETKYHDLQHVLDVTLAFTRLVDGYETEHSGEQSLGAEMALLGVIVALFHDSGYIRRTADRAHSHGAEYTKIHVSRSAQFMTDYLPTIGLRHHAELAAKVVHFTGYEINPDDIKLPDPKYRVIGALVGTADVIAQMADDEYLLKCYEHLYHEFEIAGVTQTKDEQGNVSVIYASPEDLLEKTPQFMSAIIDDRLDGHFSSNYRYAEAHFDGDNPYMNALYANRSKLQTLLENPQAELRASLSLVK